jgi:hypothetical protein
MFKRFGGNAANVFKEITFDNSVWTRARDCQRRKLLLVRLAHQNGGVAGRERVERIGLELN